MKRFPYVIINVAQSLNGYISGPEGKRITISSEEDLERVHKLRSDVDAILVGANTVIKDNPDLKVREKFRKGKTQPIRVVLDSKLRIPENSRILDGSSRTIIFTENHEKSLPGAEMILFDKGTMTITNILEKLSEHRIGKILVEGGRTVINQFINSGFINEFYIYIGDIIIGGNGTPLFDLEKNVRDIIKESSPLGSGILVSLQVEKITGGL